MSLDIRFFKEESSKELNIYAEVHYMVILKENDKPFKLLPYHISQSYPTRGYNVAKYSEEVNVDTILSTPYMFKNKEGEHFWFGTLKEAKKFIYKQVQKEYGGESK